VRPVRTMKKMTWSRRNSMSIRRITK
jgi:hypothetical protein